VVDVEKEQKVDIAFAAYRLGLLDCLIRAVENGDMKIPPMGAVMQSSRNERNYRLQHLVNLGVEDIVKYRLGEREE
jgi:hypothetical protein